MSEAIKKTKMATKWLWTVPRLLVSVLDESVDIECFTNFEILRSHIRANTVLGADNILRSRHLNSVKKITYLGTKVTADGRRSKKALSSKDNLQYETEAPHT